MNRDTMDVRLMSATRVVGVSLGRQVAIGAGVLAVLAGVAAGAPEGAKVRHGSASIQQSGDLTKITAANNTVIDYSRFNVGRHETVQFIQPSAASRVLNRIHSADPSRIDGTVTANGQVYFANPAGVIFGANSMINVGGIYAAAGNISTGDFLKGVDRFTDLTGSVINHGQIVAGEGGAVALVGKYVENTGSITAARGMVAMVSGDDVLIGAQGDHLFIRFAGAAKEAQAAAAEGDKAGVTNTGSINARGGRVALAGGDTLGLTLFSGGSVKAKNIELNNPGGDTVVTGTLDASNRSAAGKGGSVDIIGKRVGLAGATVDVSGTRGGGSARIGGDYQGQGDMPRADIAVVDSTSTIHADAVTSGDGGTVIVWSDQATDFRGTVTARGGETGPDSDGGFVEISSKGNLGFSGVADLGARNGGSDGLLLLDPTDIRILTTDSDVDDETEFPTPNNATVVFADANSNEEGAGSDLSIHESAIENATGNVLLQATDDISVEADLTLGANRNVTLEAGDDIFIGADQNGNPLGAGSITTSGTGTITLNAADDVQIERGLTTAGGAITVRADAGVNGNPADGGNGAISIAGTAAIDSGGGNIDLNAGDSTNSDFVIATGGTVNAGAGTLQIRTSTIDIQGTLTANGGITIFPGDDGTNVGLGNGAAGTFLIDATEMANLFTTGTVTIGRFDASGNTNIQNLDLSGTTNYNLTVVGDDITVNEGSSLTLANGRALRLEAIGTPGGSTITIEETVAVNGGTITLLGEDFDIDLGGGETIDAGAGTIELAPTSGVSMGVSLNNFGLSDIDLNDGDMSGLVADTLIIGSSNSGDIIFDDGITLPGSVNNLTIRSGANIREEDASTAVELTVPNALVLEAVGAVGTSAADGQFDFDAATLSVSAGNGAFLRNVDTDTSGLSVSQLNATAGNVTLTSDNAISITAGTVSAGTASVTADTGDLLVDALSSSGAMTLTATTGGVFELNTDAGADLTSTTSVSVTSATGLAGTGGVGAIETATALLSANVTGTGRVDVANTGTTLSIGTITTNDGSVVINQTGAIADDANDATTDITVGGANEATLTAGTNIGAASNSLDIDSPTINTQATTGLINVNSTRAGAVTFGTLTAGTSVTVVSAQDLEVGTVTAGNLSPVSLTATTGNLTFDQIGSSGTPVLSIILSAAAGSINEVGAGDVGVDLFATTLNATSATGFGSIGGIETTLTSASVSVTGAGNIDITETDSLNVGQITAANGDVDMTVGGTLNDDANDAVVDISGNNIAILADNGYGTANGSVDIDGSGIGLLYDTGGANINLLDAGNNGVASVSIFGGTSGGITVESTTATAGTITFTNVQAPTGNISITTTDADVSITSATATAGSFSATSGGGQTIVTTSVDTTGGNGNVTLAGTDVDITGTVAAGSGDVTLTAADATAAVQIRDDASESGFTLSTTDLTNINTTGTVTVGSGSANTNGDITITTATTGVNLSGEGYDLVLRGDQLSFVTGAAVGLDAPTGGVSFQVDGPVSRSGAGAVDVRATSLAFTNVNGAIGATGAGRIRTEASTLAFSTTAAGGAFFSNTGNLTLSDSTAAAGGVVEVVTTGTLAVNDITTTGAVTLGGTSISQTASNTVGGSLLTATASSGSIDLDTAVTSLNATAATTIDIDNTGAMTVTNASTTSGDIALSASDMAITSINAATGAADVTLTRTGGGTIGVGDGATGGMVISGSDLENITARDLTIGDNTTTAVNVGTVSNTQSANVSRAVRLNAGGASGDVNFNDNATFQGLIATALDNIQLNGDIAAIGSPAGNPGPGVVSLTANTISVGTTDGDTSRSVTGTGAVVFSGDVSQQIDLIVAATEGDFQILNGDTITTNNNDLYIWAGDLVLEDGPDVGSIDAGTGDVYILRTMLGTIRVGDYADASFPSDMIISRSDLQQITAGSLTIGGDFNDQMFVNGVTLGDTANIADTITLRSLPAGGLVTFETAASAFKGLAVQAGSGITTSVGLTTSTGDLYLDADNDSTGDGTLTIGSPLTSAGDVTLRGSDLVLSGAVSGENGTIFVSDNGQLNIGATTVDATDFDLSSAELTMLTFNMLDISTTGNVVVDGVGAAATANIDDAVLISGNNVTFSGASSTFSELGVFATNTVAINTAELTSLGQLSLNGASGTTGGDVTLTSGGLLSIGLGLTTGGSDLSISAGDLVLTGSINAGAGEVSITPNGVTTFTVGDGVAAADFNISGTELSNITASRLTVGDASTTSIGVGSVSSGQSADIGTLELVATGAGGTIAFTDDAAFTTLDAEAGAITIDGGTTLTAATDMTLTGASGGIVLGDDAGGDDVTLEADVLTLGGDVDIEGGTLTLNAPQVNGTNVGISAGGLTTDLSAITFGIDQLTIDTPLGFGGKAVTFNGVIRAARDLVFEASSLTINGGIASVGSARDVTFNVSGDTTLTGEFGTDAAGGGALGAFVTDGSGRTILSGNVETTEGYLFNEALLLAGDTVLADSGSGDAIFNDTIDSLNATPRGLTIALNTDVETGTVPVDVPLISFAEDVGATNELKHLRLNSGRGSVPSVATILVAERDASGNLVDFSGSGFSAEAGEGDVFTFNVDEDFTMGRLEKMTVVGDVVINAASASLSDITSVGKVTVDVGDTGVITLLARAGGQVLNFQGLFDVDGGLDFAAADGFDFSVIPVRDGGGLVSFGTESLENVSSTIRGAGITVQQFRNPISTQSLFISSSPNSYLDLTASGPTQTNIAQVIAGAVPRESRQNDVGGEETIGAALQTQLRQLGIYARDITGGELVDFLEGRAVYDDYPTVADPTDRDYTVAVTRLPRESVEALVNDYNSIFRKPEFDENGNIKLDEHGEPIYVVNDQVQNLLRDSLARYRAARGKDAPLDAASFRDYLESTPEEAETVQFFENVRGFLRKMELLGLSAEEFRRAKRYIIFRTIRRPSNFPSKLLEELITGPNETMEKPEQPEPEVAAAGFGR